MNKVGLIIGTLPSTYLRVAPGGIATHIDGLMKQLKQKGVHCYICYHKPFGVISPDVINSSRLRWVWSVLMGFLKLLFIRKFDFSRYSLDTNIKIAYYYWTLNRFFKRNSVDFIHVHSLHNPAPIALALLNRTEKVVITDHGFWLRFGFQSNQKILNALMDNFELASKIVYISEVALLKHCEFRLGDLIKLVKISNPTDFHEYPIRMKVASNRKHVLIFNGYKDSLYTKGLDVLLDALNNDCYLSNHIKAYFVCNQKAQDFLSKGKWNFEYEMMGPVPLSAILDLYLKGDILVTPSRSESFGLVYTEALAVGLPVVGYRPIIEEFSNTLGTYIGEPFDSNEESSLILTERIKKCLSAPFDQKYVRQRLIECFGWANAIHKYMDLYYS